MRAIPGRVLILALACMCGCAMRGAAGLSDAMARYEAKLAGMARDEAPPAPAAGLWTTTVDQTTDLPLAFVLAGDPADRPGAGDNADRVDPARPAPRRRGPAHPGQFWSSLWDDTATCLPALADDVKATATNRTSWILFAAAGVSGATLANTDVDDNVSDHYERHGAKLGSFADDFGEISGNAAVHFGITGGAYLAGLAFEDDRTYDTAKTMFNALALTGATTYGLKQAVNTRRPNGKRGGWPSGHTSSSFCFATVICHEYGPWPGAGAYVLATFTAYQRIDSQYHHLSDVVSGALIGVAFGHAVAGNHEIEILGMDVVPYVHPDTGAVGLALTKQW